MSSDVPLPGPWPLRPSTRSGHLLGPSPRCPSPASSRDDQHLLTTTHSSYLSNLTSPTLRVLPRLPTNAHTAQAFSAHRSLILSLALPSLILGSSVMYYNKSSHGAKHFTVRFLPLTHSFPSLTSNTRQQAPLTRLPFFPLHINADMARHFRPSLPPLPVHTIPRRPRPLYASSLQPRRRASQRQEAVQAPPRERVCAAPRDAGDCAFGDGVE